jgi:hypothetical protein
MRIFPRASVGEYICLNDADGDYLMNISIVAIFHLGASSFTKAPVKHMTICHVSIAGEN